MTPQSHAAIAVVVHQPTVSARPFCQPIRTRESAKWHSSRREDDDQFKLGDPTPPSSALEVLQDRRGRSFSSRGWFGSGRCLRCGIEIKARANRASIDRRDRFSVNSALESPKSIQKGYATLAAMGQWASRQLPVPPDLSKFYRWTVPAARFSVSPAFTQDGESFMVSWNAPEMTLFVRVQRSAVAFR